MSHLDSLLDLINENPDIIHDPVGILCRDIHTAEQTQRLFDPKVVRCFAPYSAAYGFRLSGLMVYAGFDPTTSKNESWWLQLQGRLTRNARIIYQ